MEFECERICRQPTNTGPSAARKWPYNLSPSSRPAINRAALSANELSSSSLLPQRLARPREARAENRRQDWRRFRLIDRQVSPGSLLPTISDNSTFQLLRYFLLIWLSTGKDGRSRCSLIRKRFLIFSNS